MLVAIHFSVDIVRWFLLSNCVLLGCDAI